VILQHFLELLGETFRIEQVIDAQAATGDLVFVARADALAGRADLLVGTLGAFARLVDGRMVRQDDRAARADLEARADIDAALLEFGNFRNQVVDVEHDTIADVAIDAVTHDARRHQIELVDLFADNQRMAGIVATLEADHTLGVVSQPVDDLPLALITPLGAHHNDILGHFY